MKQFNLEKIKATLERVPDEFDGMVAQIGFPGGFKYPDGTSVAYVAAINEFGAPEAYVPARPFLRPAVKKNKGKWTKIIQKGVPQVVLGKKTAFDVLDFVGIVAATDIKQQITETNSPPNSPATIARKGFNAPLRDTFYMRDTVQNAVNKVGSEFKAKS